MLWCQPSNLLLNSECQLMLADFGLARSLSSLLSDDGSIAVLTDYVATRWYRAPEILLGSARYTYGVDMWSSGEFVGAGCGCLCVRMLWPSQGILLLSSSQGRCCHLALVCRVIQCTRTNSVAGWLKKCWYHLKC